MPKTLAERKRQEDLKISNELLKKVMAINSQIPHAAAGLRGQLIAEKVSVVANLIQFSLVLITSYEEAIALVKIRSKNREWKVMVNGCLTLQGFERDKVGEYLLIQRIKCTNIKQE